MVKDRIHFDTVTYCCCHGICGPWTNYLTLQPSWTLWSPKTQGVRIRIDDWLWGGVECPVCQWIQICAIICDFQRGDIPRVNHNLRGTTTGTVSDGFRGKQGHSRIGNSPLFERALAQLVRASPSGLRRAEHHMFELGTFFLSVPFHLLVYEFSFSFCQ